MENLTAAELGRVMSDLGCDLQQAEASLRFLATGARGVYTLAERQRRQLGAAAELVNLAARVATEAAAEVEGLSTGGNPLEEPPAGDGPG